MSNDSADEPAHSEKSKALRDSAAKLIHESRKLREASEHIRKEAEELKRLAGEKEARNSEK